MDIKINWLEMSFDDDFVRSLNGNVYDFNVYDVGFELHHGLTRDTVDIKQCIDLNGRVTEQYLSSLYSTFPGVCIYVDAKIGRFFIELQYYDGTTYRDLRVLQQFGRMNASETGIVHELYTEDFGLIICQEYTCGLSPELGTVWSNLSL